MKNRLYLILSIIVFAMSCMNMTFAEEINKNKVSEKPMILKGLSIGMDINEARKTCEDLLSKDWIVSNIGYILIPDCMERFSNENQPIVSRRGFVIKNKGGYAAGYGFVSEDEGNGKVTQITFSGELTDYLFLTEGLHADYFVEDFTKNFGLPNLPWIRHGWAYSSPYGYDLTIMITKSIDLKKNTTDKAIQPKRKIKFN
jgi:hypothetical protein